MTQDEITLAAALGKVLIDLGLTCPSLRRLRGFDDLLCSIGAEIAIDAAVRTDAPVLGAARTLARSRSVRRRRSAIRKIHAALAALNPKEPNAPEET